eukprot:542151_1
MATPSKRYLQSYDELLYLLKKYPADERRCTYRTSFMDNNALKKACSEQFTIIKIREIFDHEREYVIATATGTIYYVTIGTLNYCTCYMLSNRSIQCKHILHILVTTLKIPKDSSLLYQNGFKPSELRKLFANTNVTLDNNMDKQIKQKYNQMVQAHKIDMYVKRCPIQEDYCVICLERFKETEAGVTWCRAKCGKNIHTKCLKSSKCSKCGDKWVYANAVKYPNIF